MLMRYARHEATRRCYMRDDMPHARHIFVTLFCYSVERELLRLRGVEHARHVVIDAASALLMRAFTRYYERC